MHTFFLKKTNKVDGLPIIYIIKIKKKMQTSSLTEMGTNRCMLHMLMERIPREKHLPLLIINRDWRLKKLGSVNATITETVTLSRLC